MSPREAIIASISELSVTPRVLRHLQKFLQSPDDDMSEAIAALKAEPVLTAAILAACNAPHLFRGAKIDDLESAVNRLGYRETYRIALLMTFRYGLKLTHVKDNRAADYLWRLAAIAACAMENLTPRQHMSASAYTVGLLHLIGCFILARNERCADAWDPRQPGAVVAQQSDICGISYPEAGALALESWGFPIQIWMPIRFQLRPSMAPDFQEAAERLERATLIGRFIEGSRPGSPGFDPTVAASEPDALTRKIEQLAHDLIAGFHPAGGLRRPLWAAAPSDAPTDARPGWNLAGLN